MTTKYDLSDREYLIMQYFWQHKGPASCAEVMKYFADQGQVWAPQTVQTFLARLEKKSSLKCTKGKPNTYTPTMSSSLYKIVNSNYANSMETYTAMLQGMKSELTKEQLEELRKIWDE